MSRKGEDTVTRSTRFFYGGSNWRRKRKICKEKGVSVSKSPNGRSDNHKQSFLSLLFKSSRRLIRSEHLSSVI